MCIIIVKPLYLSNEIDPCACTVIVHFIGACWQKCQLLLCGAAPLGMACSTGFYQWSLPAKRTVHKRKGKGGGKRSTAASAEEELLYQLAHCILPLVEKNAFFSSFEAKKKGFFATWKLVIGYWLYYCY